jgi:uncharacterized protein (TIGR02001 family)
MVGRLLIVARRRMLGAAPAARSAWPVLLLAVAMPLAASTGAGPVARFETPDRLDTLPAEEPAAPKDGPAEIAPELRPGAAGAPARPWSFNIGLYSQYASRGISYTHERPAVQATAQYADASGWYAGLWLTNVSRYFIHDGTVESDPYGGYAGSRGDWSYDVGFWRWTFIGASPPVSKRKYDTVELFASIGWKVFSVRYWREVTDYFGLDSKSAPVDAGLPPDGSSRGSIYLEGNASFELPRGFRAGAAPGPAERARLSAAELFRIPGQPGQRPGRRMAGRPGVHRHRCQCRALQGGRGPERGACQAFRVRQEGLLNLGPGFPEMIGDCHQAGFAV